MKPTQFSRYLFIFLFFPFISFSQNKFEGNWTGKLIAGKTITIVYHLHTEDGKNFTGSMDSPDQGAYDLKCSNVVTDHDTIMISMDNPKCTYTGYLKDTGKITGKFSQRGFQLALDLIKTDSVKKPNRPQTPKPPFSYKAEEVTFTNPDCSITFSGTLTIPPGIGPFPSLFLITGSGPQNRDEELFGHKPFAVIADYLSSHGYMVLRVDDRGVEGSTGSMHNANTEDLANDARAAVTYLRTRKEADLHKIGLLGHSEGGMIAPMIASKDKGIDFIIMLAGPGVKITQLLAEQNYALLAKTGLSKSALTSYSDLYRQVEEAVLYASDSAHAYKNINTAVSRWVKETPGDIVQATINITNDSSQQKIVMSFLQLYTLPWYRYFLAYNPKPDLEKLSCKVLALNGDKDIQVLSLSNIPAIQEALAKSRSKDYEAKELPGLNHLFQHCNSCTIQEYGNIEETFSPDALKIIGDWLDKHVK